MNVPSTRCAGGSQTSTRRSAGTAPSGANMQPEPADMNLFSAGTVLTIALSMSAAAEAISAAASEYISLRDRTLKHTH